MIFHLNPLLEDSDETSSLIFFKRYKNNSNNNVSSAAVFIRRFKDYSLLRLKRPLISNPIRLIL